MSILSITSITHLLLKQNIAVDEISKILNITEIIPVSFLIHNKLLSFIDLLQMRRQKSFIDFRQWVQEQINNHDSKNIKDVSQNILKLEGIPKIWKPNESIISIVTRDKINAKLKDIPAYHYKEDGHNFVTAQNIRFRDEKARQTEGKRYKISRNDPCPCGSGKKYKQCCLKE